MKGWPSCLPVMRMAAFPGLRAGISACHESLFLPSVNAWPSRLADSRVGVWVVSSLTGLPGRPCPSRLHANMLPCLLMAMILLLDSTVCMYCWFPLSVRLGASPGFQAQTWPSMLVMMAWSLLAVILLVCTPSGRLTAVRLLVLLVR